MDYASQLVTLRGLCEKLEALEAMSFEVFIAHRRDAEDSIGSLFLNVEKVLVKPGWSALRQVSFKVPIAGSVVGDSAATFRNSSLLLSAIQFTLSTTSSSVNLYYIYLYPFPLSCIMSCSIVLHEVNL